MTRHCGGNDGWGVEGVGKEGNRERVAKVGERSEGTNERKGKER